jgi:hypothetical protein
VGRFLGHSLYGRLALSYLVRFVQVRAEIWKQAGPAVAGDASGIGSWVLRDQVPEETLQVLLTSHGPEVAAEVAGNLWSGKPRGEIPTSLQIAWRNAVIEHLHDGHELEEIARRHPDIAFAWIKRRLNPTREERYSDRGFQTRDHMRSMVAALSRDQRRELIELFAADNFDSELLAVLIGADLDFLRFALSRPETRKRATACLGLPGNPVTFWIERAVLFLDAGFSEEEVMWASEVIGGSWSGAESRHHQEKLDLFRPLLAEEDPRIRRIGLAAVELLTKRRDESRQKERIAAVKGTLA